MESPEFPESQKPEIAIGLNAVILAVTEEQPRVLTVRDAGASHAKLRNLPALPFGPLDPKGDRTLEKGLRGWVRKQTGLELGYVEQLYTFGDRHRESSELQSGPRVLSIAYLALTREQTLSGGGRAFWQDCYSFLPWEDWRNGRPPLIDRQIVPALETWLSEDPSTGESRLERVSIAFSMGGGAWDGERVLERYELLYEAGLVPEALRDLASGESIGEKVDSLPSLGRSMRLDHRRMLATALGRIRGKIRYRPVVFELLPPTFTLLRLQRVVEGLAGVRLHKQNFRRLVDQGGLVEGTGQRDSETGGRPAELFRFRREVLRERTAPGVGLPGG
jgi:hypothetical protein